MLCVLLRRVLATPACARPRVLLEASSAMTATTTSRGGPPSAENWEFAEEFHFPVRDMATDCLTVSLYACESERITTTTLRRWCLTQKDEDRRRHNLLGRRTLGILDLDLEDGYYYNSTTRRRLEQLECAGAGAYTVYMNLGLHYLREMRTMTTTTTTQE